MAWVEHRHPDLEALAGAVACQLAEACGDAIASRGHAVAALAGGQTPWPAYRRFATRPLEWRRLTVLPTDERCVPHDHPACNLQALRTSLAEARGIGIVPLTTPDGDPGASEALARSWLAAHPAPFDAVVAGMGADGHVASLFPGAARLARALAPDADTGAWRIDPDPLPPEAPFPRISLGLARLLEARTILLVVAGDAKRAVLGQAQAAPDPMAHPVAALLHAPGRLVHVHWSP